MPIIANPDTGEVKFLDAQGNLQPAKTAINPETKQLLAYDGGTDTWLPVTSHGKGILNYIDDAVRALANGMTFNYADELAAGANTLVNGKSYAENKAAEDARDANIPTAIKVPGEIAGGVATALASAPVAGPIAAATGIAKLPAIARTVLGGAAAGGLYSSGAAEGGVSDRAAAAVPGAVLGGAVGAAAPYVAAGANRVVQAVKGAISPETSATNQLGRALVRDNATPESLTAAADAIAKDRPGVATVADVGGENVKGLVERVAQTPGAGRTIVQPFLTDRQTQQMGRIADDLSSLTGTNKTALTAINDSMTSRAEAAKPLYDQAFNFNARNNPDIYNAWLKETHQGWGEKILNSDALKRNLQSEYGVADYKQAPLMVLIDAWKKAADDTALAFKQSGEKNTARIIGETRDRVLSVVDDANPLYAAARSAWAGPSRYIDAIQDGKSVLNKNVGSDELRENFDKLNPSEQEAFRIGAVSAIKAKMGNDASNIADMTKYLRSPEMREKIMAIMPTDEAAQAWQRRLNFEVESSKLVGRAVGNSATARRLAETKDSENIVGDLILEFATGGSGAGFFRQILTAMPTKIRDTIRSRSDRLLAEHLTDPQALDDLRGLMDRAQRAVAMPSRRSIAAGTVGTNAALNGK